MERRRAERAAARSDAPADEATVPTGEHTAAGPQFPFGMHNTSETYTSSVSTDVAAYEDLPDHHLLAIRNLIATTNDESYHVSASDLPPATSHGYAEWDFSSVPDPMMFQWFLDATDYWFSCSDDSRIGSYDPARECFVVVTDKHAEGTNGAGVGDGDTPQNSGTSVPPTSLTGGIGINAQLAQARELEAKLAEEYQQVRLLRATIAGEALARANMSASWAGRLASASTPTSMSTTRTLRCEQAKSSLQLQRCSGQCPNHWRPRHATCAARRRPSSSRQPHSRPKSRRPAYAISPARGMTAALKARRHPSTRAAPRGSHPTRAGRQSGRGSLTRTDKPRTATPARS
jgi:hypothetical protein